MTDDKKERLDSGTYSGSRWVKADFHVHYPGVSDYEYKGSDSLNLLADVLTKLEYGFAVILKHQEFPTKEEILKLQDLCPKTKLIPGAELNIFVDALSQKVGKDYFFHCILAVDPDSEKPFDYILHKAKEEYSYRSNGNSYPSGFTSSINDIGHFFLENGAIFLPAHLHQSKKVEISRSIDDIYDDNAFLGWVAEKCFSALEVRDPSTACFFNGDSKTDQEISIPKAICVQSSDAHSHEHITERNRYTWSLVEQLCFEELRASLNYPHRILIECPVETHSRIESVAISGSFFPDVILHMNSRINALIGCKGSGKTSVLESLRFLFDTEIPGERKEAVSAHIKHILGPSGRVDCHIIGMDGKKYQLSRRADSPTRLSIVDESGVNYDSKSLGDIFEITILGWHEIEAIADSASLRIGLVDKVGSGSKIRKLYKEISTHVESARDDMPMLQQKLKRLDDALQVLWQLQEKRNKLEKLDKAELTHLQTQYEWFLNSQEVLHGYSNKIQKHKTKLNEQLPFDLLTEFRSDFEEGIPETIAGKFSEAETLLKSIKDTDDESLNAL